MQTLEQYSYNIGYLTISEHFVIHKTLQLIEAKVYNCRGYYKSIFWTYKIKHKQESYFVNVFLKECTLYYVYTTSDIIAKYLFECGVFQKKKFELHIEVILLKEMDIHLMVLNNLSANSS